MMFGLIEALEETNNPLEHVFFAGAALAPEVHDNQNVICAGVQRHNKCLHGAEGNKWYGVHLGASKTPFRETDPR
jgi:hypothetical protein